MPIYEYRCQSCGREFEEWQKITESPVEICQTCGGKTSRLISSSSFILKGTGWYVTDYARKDGSSSPSHSPSKKGPSSEAACATPASSASDSSKD
jgi:putative FmdB family regulatory protein